MAYDKDDTLYQCKARPPFHAKAGERGARLPSLSELAWRKLYRLAETRFKLEG